MSDLVGVTATFSVGGQTVHVFESSERESSGQKCSPHASPSGTGHEVGVEGSDKYDHRYTGRHDHGTLPALKSGGPHGQLIKALLEAKEDSDAFLTGLINQELTEASDGSKAGQPKVQREQAALVGGRNNKEEGAPTEAMELCDVAAGGAARHEREPLPPAPPNTQPAKRPRP